MHTHLRLESMSIKSIEIINVFPTHHVYLQTSPLQCLHSLSFLPSYSRKTLGITGASGVPKHLTVNHAPPPNRFGPPASRPGEGCRLKGLHRLRQRDRGSTGDRGDFEGGAKPQRKLSKRNSNSQGRIHSQPPQPPPKKIGDAGNEMWSRCFCIFFFSQHVGGSLCSAWKH